MLEDKRRKKNNLTTIKPLVNKSDVQALGDQNDYYPQYKLYQKDKVTFNENEANQINRYED